MKKEYIYSCLLGGTFFAVPYLACGIGALPSAAIGVAAYGAGILLFRDKKKVDISDNVEAEDKLAIKQAKALKQKLIQESYEPEKIHMKSTGDEFRKYFTSVVELIINFDNPKREEER